MNHTPDSISALIADLGITVTEFARRCGVNRFAVHAWLAGKYKPNRAHSRRISAMQGGLRRRKQ